MTKTNTSNFNLTFSCYTSNMVAATENLFSHILFLFQQIQIIEIIIASIVFIIIHALHSKKHHGLTNWPILGMLPSLMIGLKTNMYEGITETLKHQNGTFRFKGPWFTSFNCIITSEPQNLEHLLKTKFNIFPKGNFFKDTVSDLLGDGIFAVDNETWQKQRKTASIEFHSTKFRKLTTDSLFELVNNRLIPVLDSSLKKSVSIDLQDILLRLTFDNVCMIAFDVDPSCLQLHLPEIPFARAFEDATEATLLRFVAPVCVWKAMRFLNLGMERKLKESIQKVDEFAENVIRARKKELSLEHDMEDDKRKSDLLTVFMKLKDENGKAYSDKFLRDICVSFILAGRDTSSVALSWFFWLLNQNHEVEEKILEEICRVVSQREDININKEVFNDSLRFKPEEIKKMGYLHAALSETLRLYPSVPMDHKEVVEDDTFPDGTKLKKGTKIIYAIYSMGRMESIWGKDCLEFKPERWLTKDGHFIGESAYKFTAFNGGPRLCLGKDFAYYQMKYVAASIIFRYHVKVVENHLIVPKLSLTLYMKHGLKVNLHRRCDEEIHKYLKIS
ncbi:putative alkane 1-monooxygenase [Medicago truncatula]|uniref:Cytochrome P450 family protein n=1 Tax=Medicago truncatula TaxID=3880 RepID=A0A072VS41_MEDTR|nr:cytochrome P450 86B1 [Medicago truncatula]KEH40920.1 cytochrome P450 family protein [Medicago truncatula]RHN78330.1 putative alkane 1-monooxygenase [Medicago truncatula]